MLMTLVANGSVALTVIQTILTGKECLRGGCTKCTSTCTVPVRKGSGASALPAVDTRRMAKTSIGNLVLGLPRYIQRLFFTITMHCFAAPQCKAESCFFPSESSASEIPKWPFQSTIPIPLFDVTHQPRCASSPRQSLHVLVSLRQAERGQRAERLLSPHHSPSFIHVMNIESSQKATRHWYMQPRAPSRRTIPSCRQSRIIDTNRHSSTPWILKPTRFRAH